MLIDFLERTVRASIHNPLQLLIAKYSVADAFGLHGTQMRYNFCGIIELRTDELLVQKTDGNWINHDFFADFRFLVLKLWASV